MVRAMSAVLCVMVIHPCADAQNAERRFEVTSVRRNTQSPQERESEFGCQSGQFVARAQWIDFVIRYAYEIEPFQLVGMPNWTDEEMFDMEARANPDTTDAQCREMVRALLADRFKLAIWREVRQVPVLALVVDKNGPKIRRAGPDDEANGPGFKVNGYLMQMFDPQLKGWTMAQLVQALGIAQLGVPVVDKTGLERIYKISLAFSQRGTEGKDPEVTTALREQLGLRLESQRGKIEFLNVTRLERPDAN